MPQTAAYFRNQAQRLREIARSHQTGLSARLIEMASELERKADELDKQTRAGEGRGEQLHPREIDAGPSQHDYNARDPAAAPQRREHVKPHHPGVRWQQHDERH